MKILLVGISVRAMAESAVHSGYATIALDAFGDQDLRILSESYSLQHDFHTTYSPKALCEASRSLAFDAVAYTSNLENHADILARFTDSHRIIGNSPQAVQLVRHWPTLFAKLTQAGFSVPETIFAGDSREIDHRRQWLAKPLLSGGGHGIEFVTPDNYCIPGFMLQEYIPGKPCSASFVSNGHESVLLGITEQLMGLHQFGSRGFRYCGNVLPLPELGEPADGVKILEQANNLAAFLTQEYGLIGVNGMDFILKGDRVYLTEVNPRYSASMELIERAYKLPIFHLHMQAILEGRLPEFGFGALSKNKKFFGKAIVFAERNAKAPDTQSWPEKDIRDVPLSGAQLPKGGPICTILTHNPTYNEALARLTDRAGMLKEEIYGKTDCNPDYGAFYQTGDRDFDWKGTRRISESH